MVDMPPLLLPHTTIWRSSVDEARGVDQRRHIGCDGSGRTGQNRAGGGQAGWGGCGAPRPPHTRARKVYRESGWDVKARPAAIARAAPWVALRSFSRVFSARSQMLTTGAEVEVEDREDVFSLLPPSASLGWCVGSRRRPLWCLPLPERDARGDAVLGC